MEWDLNICRICLQKQINLTSIIENDVQKSIMIITNVKISPCDGFPQLICDNCLTELKIAMKFKHKCEESQAKLNNYIQIKNDEDCKERNRKIEEASELSKNATSGSEQYEEILISYETNDKHETVIIYKCTACGKPDIIPSAHVCNVAVSYDLKIYKCHICSDLAVSKINYDNHIMTHNDHSSVESNITSDNKENERTTTKKQLQCELCGKITKWKSQLISHMRKHTGERPYKCNICEKSFRCQAFLKKHLQLHTGVKNFHCVFCPRSFVLKNDLNYHIKSHSEEKRYECHICNNKFKTNRTLINHIRAHTGERNYPCTECEKAFVNKFDLRRHLTLHEKHKAIKAGTYVKPVKPKKFQCESCGKCFAVQAVLRKHMKFHSDEKPFLCEVCGKSFRAAYHRNVHMRIHTGTKPYTCNYCKASFAQSSNLKIHMTIHTGRKSHNCTICQKGYVRKCDLISHMNKHSASNESSPNTLVP